MIKIQKSEYGYGILCDMCGSTETKYVLLKWWNEALGHIALCDTCANNVYRIIQHDKASSE